MPQCRGDKTAPSIEADKIDNESAECEESLAHGGVDDTMMMRMSNRIGRMPLSSIQGEGEKVPGPIHQFLEWDGDFRKAGSA